MSHNNLQNYYQLLFNFKQSHKWEIETIENLIPFEMQIYITLLSQWLEEESDRIRQQSQSAG